MVLDVANNSSFRDRPQRQDISDHKVGLLTTVDELAGVHSLSGDEELLLVLVSEGVTEGDARKRRTTPGIVDDLGDDALGVSIALAEVEGAELSRAFAMVSVGLEDRPCSLTLSSDHPSHGGRFRRIGFVF